MLQILNPFKAGEEFRKLKSEEKWKLALIIVLVAGLLSAAGKSIILQKEHNLKSQYSEEELREPLEGDLALNLIFLVGYVPVSWILKSMIFHVFARGLGGENVKVSSTIHLVAFTHVPCIFKGLFDLFLGLTYHPPSYDEFVYQLQNPEIFRIFIREYNIFFLAFTLMIIAIREQYNLSNQKAFFVVFSLYFVIWIVQIALILSGSLFGGGI